jgi:hypothetical protein
MILNIAGSAQNVEAYSSVDTDSIMIGDQFQYKMGINVPTGFVVAWPQLTDTISKNIEIIDIQQIDTSYQENTLILNRRFTLTSFDSGYFEIPSYTFKFRHENDTIDFESNTLRYYIQVFTPAVDTSQAFKAIKGPISEPYTFREALPWIALGLLIIVVVFLIIWYLQKRQNNKPLFATKPKPELPPHIIAFQMLEELRLAKVWQSGRVKEYYTQLTDITRDYIERRFLIDAPEMTTDEILDALKEKDINTEISEKLKSALSLADLVKFAKAKPTPLENDVCLNHCVDFVKETKQETVLRVDEKEESKTNKVAEV